MAQSLVIVESPAKARTINRYLGRDYVVKSSVGHVRDLPVGGRRADAADRTREAAKTRKLPPKERAEYKARRARAQLVRRMGVDPDNGWKAEYETLPGKEKVVDELRRFADRAEQVYLATDLDREGEAIAWHLQELIGGDPDRFRRVVFSEITKSALEEAFRNPGRVDENRVNAQQARRFLDRVVGFELSPLLWAKVARNLSAGRVQSVAVRLIVEREREIRAFIPEEYWEGFADLARQAERGDAQHRFGVARDGGKRFRPADEESANEALERLRRSEFMVEKREDRPTRSRPNPPFITSTLQQAAATRLGFSVRRTMTVAQRLYEAGHITYMRTDSMNLSADAVAHARAYIGGEFGQPYLPDRPNAYRSRSSAQEAHEAIRPTAVGSGPSGPASLSQEERRLYGLIWRQFVACQMTPARYTSTTVTVRAGDFELTARGRNVKFDGFTRVLAPASRRDEDKPLPEYVEGETLRLVDANVVQHFTKPPPRYTEASLVRELERRGIGRPSTYASIISTIQDRGYVTLESRRFHVEKIGELVTDRLVENFSDLMDYSFTAGMERELDQIADGERGWHSVLDSFYGDFSEKLAHAGSAEGGMRANVPTETDIPCGRCGRPMQVRTASTGVFLGCSGYRLPPRERCTNTMDLLSDNEVVDAESEAGADEDDERESKILRAKRRCRVCNTAMDAFLIDEARKLHVCGRNPDCAGFELERGKFRIKGYEGPVVECDKCGGEMQLKSGRFGKYFGCTNTSCTNTRKLLRNGQPAPPRADPVPMPELRCRTVDDHYVLRDGANGIFLAASAFPRNRETRPPLVSELKPHANELDPKFAYLLEAPESDPDGNPAQIRFARKTRQQFLASEKDGNATKWRAFYRNGKWEEASPASGTKTAHRTRGKPARARPARKRRQR
ncbi:MAG: type I DNA topoisomerase [Gammaproteobacteria bacterium]|nr:type I DNA topoisomerase [Gammaproteobacteria bacterium]